MSSDWRPFVPDQVVDLVRQGAPPVGQVIRRPAVVLFADVAGFTALSELLGASGRRGTEELNRRLNVYFGHMIELVVRYGGTVVRFAGDAVTAVFPARATRRAVQCALDMQAASSGFELTTKIGLGLGPLSGVVLGDPSIRLEYVVMGAAADRAAGAEHVGAPGKVVADEVLLDACPGVASGERRSGGVRLIAGLDPPALPEPADPPGALPDTVAARLAPFLHQPIAARLSAGRRGLVNEHRKVTVAFVAMPRWGAARLQQYVVAAVRTIDRHGGHLLQIDTADKGNLLVICFGAPVAHEDDEERAVRCCLELLNQPGGSFRAGLTTGFAYCGEVGSERRREYLVMGDSVNLAARLMQAARPGQLLVDCRTHGRVAGSVVAQPLEPITVKGKAAPVEVWAVRGMAEPSSRSVPASERIFGRDRELARLDMLVRQAAAGAGQVVAITGAAGVGKSRLAAEVVGIAAAAGFGTYRGAAHARETQTSYLVWRPVWRQLLGVDSQAPQPMQQARLREYVAGLDGSGQRAPLLAPVVNVPVPDTEFTAGLDVPARSEFLGKLLCEVLHGRSAAGPVLLVLEDCHWMDPASATLLGMLARAIADQRVLLVMTTRTPVANSAALEPVAGLGHLSEIALPELPAADAERLVASRLLRLYGANAELPGELLGSLVARGAGNPFFLEELANLVHARGLDPRVPGAIELPDSLHGLLTARLDQLGEGEQATVKLASVIGPVFRASWVWGAYPELGGVDVVRTHLDRLVRLDLTSLRHSGPELEYAFRHGLTQEAAYDTLTFAMRAQLHDAVGAFIERTYAGRLADQVDALAYHYGRSGNTVKQLTWFRAAGDAARAAFANEVAIGHYQRLLPLLPNEQRGEVLVHLGTLWHLTGQWADAERAYHQALSVAKSTQDGTVLATSQRDLGLLCTYRRSYADAIGWLTRAGAEFERLGDDLGVASTLDRLSFAYFQQGQYAEALAEAERHLAIATAAGDLSGQSAALENLGLVHGHTSNYAEAIELLGRALRIAEDAGNMRGVSYAANDLAGVYVRQGDHVRAMTYLEKARAAAERIGFRSLVAVLIGNAGELYREHGDHARALGCFNYALRIAFDLGDWTSLLGQLGNLGLTAVAQGRTELAERLLDRAVDLARARTAPYLVCEFLYWLAKLHADHGRWPAAEKFNGEALEIADRIDHRHHRLHCRLLSLRLANQTGQLDADAAAVRLRALLPDWSEPAEQAVIHAELWEITANPVDRDRAAGLYRVLYERAPSEEIRERLGRLSGDALPARPALPPLPPEVTHTDLDLDAVLSRIDWGL